MKKLITLLCLLPALCQAQTQQVTDTTKVKSPLFVIEKKNTGSRYDSLTILPATTTAAGTMSAAQVTTLNQTVTSLNSINGIVTQQGQRITDIETQLAGTATTGHTDVYDNAYTLQSTDNGKVIYVHVSCTVTCPNLPEDFHCVIMRTGSGRVQVLGAKSPSSLTWINGQYRRVEVYYRTSTERFLTGDLTR